jgi:hypothetical protein
MGARKKKFACPTPFRFEKSPIVAALIIDQPQRGSQSVGFARFVRLTQSGPRTALTQQAIINFARGETFEAQIKADEDPNLVMIKRAFDRAFICEAADKAGERVSRFILLWRRIRWLQDGLAWFSNELERLKQLAAYQEQLMGLLKEAAQLGDNDFFTRVRQAIKRAPREKARYMSGFIVCAAFSKLYENSGLSGQRHLPTATQVKDCIKKFFPDFADSNVGFFGNKLGLKFSPGKPGRRKTQRPAGCRPPPRQRTRERPIRDVTSPMSKVAEYYNRQSEGRISVEGRSEPSYDRTPLDDLMENEDEERQS